MHRVEASSDVFHAIASPVRRALLDRLQQGECAVGELAEPFDVSVPAVSQQLRILLDAGLVEERRSGRQRLYSLRPGPLKEVSEWVARYEQFWSRRLKKLGAYLERKHTRR
jgi:DNA-binding transcriptional ArsR family regulator